MDATTTKPSEAAMRAAMEYAREWWVPAGASDWSDADLLKTYPGIESRITNFAEHVDRLLRPAIELAEFVVTHPDAAYGMGDRQHAERCRMQVLARVVLDGKDGAR